MTIKDFFKPTVGKILLALVMFLVFPLPFYTEGSIGLLPLGGLFVYTTLYSLLSYGHVNLIYADLFQIFVIPLIGSYILSCLITAVWSKIRVDRKLKSGEKTKGF